MASHTAAAGSRQPAAAKPMRVLILGGTGFIGPHFVQAAVERGHRVSVFNRGKEQADLSAGVERLLGDRNGDLQAIEGRDWDAVFDTAAYVPNWVRTLGQALKGRVGHYTFISTVMTYRFPGARDEDSALETYTDSVDPYTLTYQGKQYGALKVLCEQEAERQFPGRTLVLRPGHIVGPRESVGAFTFLVARLHLGGEMLAAGDPLAPAQLIDARDLANWAVTMSEGARPGIFNTVGPAQPLGWAELLGGVRAAFDADTHLTWVPLSWLMERNLKPFSSLLFWATEFGYPGFCQVSNDKAQASGLTFRPLNATVTDTLAWYRSLPGEEQQKAVLRLDEKNPLLKDSMAREQQLLAEWRLQRTRYG